MALGVTKQRAQTAPDRLRGVRDPAGHPFCLRT
ncbi:hypothetical protein [Actinomycetospora termitidis]